MKDLLILIFVMLRPRLTPCSCFISPILCHQNVCLSHITLCNIVTDLEYSPGNHSVALFLLFLKTLHAVTAAVIGVPAVFFFSPKN